MSRIQLTLVVVVVATVFFVAGRYTASSASAPDALTAPPYGGRPPVSRLPAQPGMPSGTIGEALREPDQLARLQKMASAISSAGPESLPEVRSAFRAKWFPFGAPEAAMLMHYWALYEPEEATRWAFERSPHWYKEAVTVAAVTAWAEADPTAAAPYVLEATSAGGPIVAEIDRALVRGWYRGGHPGLPEFLESLDPGIQRQRSLGALLGEIILASGSQAAIDWVDALPAEPWRFKLAAHRQLATKLAEMDLETVLVWCDTRCDGPSGNLVRSRIATVWAAEEPEATMSWLAEQPAGKERDAAVKAAFRTWMLYDREALRAWMREESVAGIDQVEPWLWPAAGSYAMMISWDEPENAFAWAQLIDDEETRSLAVISIARRWRTYDEAAAEAWLQQSSLSEEDRQKARQVPAGLRGPRKDA